MGNYSYLCRHCGKGIREGEKAHLIHLRHSEVLGETEGVYNGYGGVDGDDVFDRHGEESVGSPCCHEEIMQSKYHLDDSYDDSRRGEKHIKLLDGKPISLVEFGKKMHEEDPVKYPHAEGRSFEWDWDLQELCKSAYDALEDAELPKTHSGILAYHAVCYHKLVNAGKPLSEKPSDSDPNQGWGKPRAQFM